MFLSLSVTFKRGAAKQKTKADFNLFEIYARYHSCTFGDNMLRVHRGERHE